MTTSTYYIQVLATIIGHSSSAHVSLRTLSSSTLSAHSRPALKQGLLKKQDITRRTAPLTMEWPPARSFSKLSMPGEHIETQSKQQDQKSESQPKVSVVLTLPWCAFICMVNIYAKQFQIGRVSGFGSPRTWHCEILLSISFMCNVDWNVQSQCEHWKVCEEKDNEH